MGGSTAERAPDRNYLPRLDGLRAVAIVLVLLDHFYAGGLSLGRDGVTLFFVISGFLITSILLGYPAELRLKDAARIFYVRRALRLVPVYYLCIAITAMLNIGDMRQTWWLDALWLTNFRVALDGHWGRATHFWSLCVEEQFYLLWFPLVMLVPRRLLLTVIISFIVLGPLYRLTMVVLEQDWFVNVMLPGAIDSLAVGALLAYGSRYSRHTPLWKRFERVRMPMTLFFLAAVWASESLGVSSTCLLNCCSICLVSVAADTGPDWRLDWLGGTAIRHLGRISYSLYILHYFVPQIFHVPLALYWSRSHQLNLLTRFVALSLISIAVAEISWQLVEKPFNRLKGRIAVQRLRSGVSPVEAPHTPQAVPAGL